MTRGARVGLALAATFVVAGVAGAALRGVRIGGWEGYKCRKTLGVLAAAPLPEAETSCSDQRFFRLDSEPFLARFPIDAAGYEAFVRAVPGTIAMDADRRALYEHFLADDARVGGRCAHAPHSADCATCRVAEVSGRTVIADWVDGCAVVKVLPMRPLL